MPFPPLPGPNFAVKVARRPSVRSGSVYTAVPA